MISKTSIETIKCKDINQITIEATEEILPQNIAKFTQQNLALAGFKTTKYTQFHTIFYPHLQKIQICFFDAKNRFSTIFDFLAQKFEAELKNANYCAIFVADEENFCVIFHKGKFFHFAKLDFVEDFSDVANFFEKRLEISVDKVLQTSEIEFEKAKNSSRIFKNLKESPLLNICLATNFGFILVFLIFVFYVFFTNQANIKSQIEQKNQILNSLNANQKEPNLSKNMDDIFELLTKYDLKLKSLELENSTFVFEGFGEDRQKLEDFFKKSGCILIKSEANLAEGISFVAKYKL